MGLRQVEGRRERRQLRVGEKEADLAERKMEWVVWGGLLVTILAILTLFVVLPVRSKPLPVLGAESDFALTNQNHQNVTLNSLRGEVWIADVIFTRCAGQCPIMSAHMQAIQDAMPEGLPVKLVTFTTDPDFDTPDVLKQYAARFNAHDEWMFLTGSKAALRQATVDGLKLGVIDKGPGERENPADLFIHSEKFVLIDRQGQIRGYFDGESAEGATEALAAAKVLARQ